jgi:hypothetical protein
LFFSTASNFTWDDLHKILNNSARGWQVSDGTHFSFSQRPAEGWTVIMLNTYEVSLMQPESSVGYQEAKRLLNEYNPNNVVSVSQGVNFFQDLNGRKSKYVPFNGGE